MSESTTPTVNEITRRMTAAHVGLDADVDGAVETADEVFEIVKGADFDQRTRQNFAIGVAAIFIDAASVSSDPELNERGVDILEQLSSDETLDVSLRSQIPYNLGNGLMARLRENGKAYANRDDPIETRWVAVHKAEKALCQRIRVLFRKTADDSSISNDIRARALCNLGNLLRDWGRWLESYDAYADALRIDSTNGVAALNCVSLLRNTAFRNDLGHREHLLSLSDEYLEAVHKNRGRVVELAGESVAARWDQITPTNTSGRARHTGDPNDPYQKWIVRHRLALTFSVEGLGSDEALWDAASVERISTDMGQLDTPAIFAMMNALKAEYLVARRLAFESETMIAEAGYGQHPDDTGTYVNTLDHAIYGEPYAKAVLAQRATRDILDKIAVAANEHFKFGLEVASIGFSHMWIGKKNQVRSAFPWRGGGEQQLALADLADDIKQGGMYEAMHELRNAGTHRFVVATDGTATGVTKDSISYVKVSTLLSAIRQSLGVTRAAYLYLVAFVHAVEDAKSSPKFDLPMILPNQR